MAELVVRGAEVLLDDRWLGTDLGVADGLIVSASELAGDVEVVDGSGLLVAPGFVDLQCNGAVGIDLASEPERLWELAAALTRWGVTAWLPTIVTSPAEVVNRAQETLLAGPPDGWVGAWPMGLHLEGPFLNPDRRGAHRRDLLAEPTLAAIDTWSLERGVAVVTLAPELPGALDVVEALVGRGVVVSLGHSNATATEARAAIDRGAACVTHLFNAMSSLGHRQPGLPGVAMVDERVRVGLITDGIHVDPTVVTLVRRAVGDRLVLVTDAISALGLPAGVHHLGRAEVTADATSVRLPDGTLAGSNLSMDQAVRNLVAFTSCAPADAIRAASTTPAALLGDDNRGHLRPGARADFVLLTPELDVVATYVSGRPSR